MALLYGPELYDSGIIMYVLRIYLKHEYAPNLHRSRSVWRTRGEYEMGMYINFYRTTRSGGFDVKYVLRGILNTYIYFVGGADGK